MGNLLIYQAGRPQEINVRGPATGKMYQFRKCSPGLHNQSCPVVEVDDADAPGLVGHIVADCRQKPFIPTIAPKADHDGAFMRIWAEYQAGQRHYGNNYEYWFKCVHEARK